MRVPLGSRTESSNLPQKRRVTAVGRARGRNGFSFTNFFGESDVVFSGQFNPTQRRVSGVSRILLAFKRERFLPSRDAWTNYPLLSRSLHDPST